MVVGWVGKGFLECGLLFLVFVIVVGFVVLRWSPLFSGRAFCHGRVLCRDIFCVA